MARFLYRNGGLARDPLMPSLAQYRSALATECGPFIGPGSYDVRATSGSDTTKLVCGEYPIRSGIDQQDLLSERPLYLPAASEETDKNRYILSYDPPTGTITPDLPWSFPLFSTTAGNTYAYLENFLYLDLEHYLYQDLEGLGANGIGSRFEILGPFDAPTMHRLINDGLKQCWLVVEVATTPTILTTRHDLSLVAPWLQDTSNVLQVGLLGPGEDRNLQDPFARRITGQVEHDGGTFYLNTGSYTFNDGDVLWLRCLKRAYDHCRPSGGAYGEQVGLSLETDESPVERDWLVASALVLAWRRFAHLLEPGANQRLIRDQATAAAWFSDLCHKHLGAVRPQMKFIRQRSFGPSAVA